MHIHYGANYGNNSTTDRRRAQSSLTEYQSGRVDSAHALYDHTQIASNDNIAEPSFHLVGEFAHNRG
ncbi:hypothetical protein NKJ84_32385 [Mesorhizobium sp. M0048]|uniref:hypothetical protein n=1 Tax=Mesorhizobium sp. M0048 TaxID=2956860 RepID=UPI00333B120F